MISGRVALEKGYVACHWLCQCCYDAGVNEGLTNNSSSNPRHPRTHNLGTGKASVESSANEWRIAL